MKELADPLFLVTHSTSFQLIAIIDNISIVGSGCATKEIRSRHLYPLPIPTKLISCSHVVSFTSSLHMIIPPKKGSKYHSRSLNKFNNRGFIPKPDEPESIESLGLGTKPLLLNLLRLRL